MVDWFTERLPRALTPAAPSDTSSSTGDEWPALPAGEAQPSLRYVSDLHGTPSDWIIDVVTLTEHQREHGAQPGHLEAVVVLPGAAESGPHAPPSSPPSPSSPRLTSPPAGTKERVDDCSSAACGGSVGLGSSRALALAAAAFGRHLDGVDGQALGLQRASGASTGDTSAVSAPASPRAAVAADPSAGKPGAAATQLVHLTAASGASVASPTTTAASSSRPEAALAASESSAGHQVPEQRTLDAGAGSFPAQHGQGWRWRCARAGAHLQALLWRECTSITRNPADVAGALRCAWPPRTPSHRPAAARLQSACLPATARRQAADVQLHRRLCGAHRGHVPRHATEPCWRSRSQRRARSLALPLHAGPGVLAPARHA